MKKQFFNKITSFSLLSQLIVLICTLVLSILITFGWYSNTKYSDTIEEQIGQRALDLAHVVAEIPEIKEAFAKTEPSQYIQPLVESIRVKTDAEFIVVGNKEGIRYAHPIPDRIGQRMVGDDNERALLHGESYISQAVGSLGPSIRGKVPILSDEQEIIGVVSVGFLLDDIEMTIGSYMEELWWFLFLFVAVGVVGSIFISLHVKKSILGLEPHEIAKLYQEREAMLQSIHEAVIAVDTDGKVTMVNDAAKKVLIVEKGEAIGRSILELLPQTKLMEVLETGESQFNQELWIKDERFVVSRVPIYNDSKLIGAVSTFRNTTEIERLVKELSKVQQYSEALRVQTHEFSNKLNTISGLLQLGKTDEAVEFINTESKEQQEWIHFFIDRVADPYISAVLLGKLNRAHELGIKLSIDDDSRIVHPLTEKQREGLITVLGNLLENAYDAVMETEGNHQVNIFFSDGEGDIVFEVEDNGKGIDPVIREKVFTRGFTTKKGSHRGIGLSLVFQLVQDLGGNLSIDSSGLGGACFIVEIPRLDRGDNREQKSVSSVYY